MTKNTLNFHKNIFRLLQFFFCKKNKNPRLKQTGIFEKSFLVVIIRKSFQLLDKLNVVGL